MNTTFVAAAVALGLLGFVAAGAWFPGGPGMGPGEGRGLEMAAFNWSNETASAFHDAVLAGDYAAAKRLSDEFGVGQRMMSVLDGDSFQLYSQMVNAMQPKDPQKALELRQQLQEKLGGDFPALAGGPAFGKGRSKAFAHGFERGLGRGIGMRNGAQGGCPFADADDVAEEAVSGTG
ncbi:MAG: hypothetical protein V1787_01185 [Candidatus Micrarchaeota archaeon]